MIRMSGVSVRFPNGVQALTDINLHIKPGEFVSVVGATGSGKSTLVKLIYREEGPTTGSVWVQGEDVARLRPRDVPQLRRKIGVVFQDFRLLPQKTGFENVAFALQVTGADRSRIMQRALEVLRLVGLAERSRMYPEQLSGGEQQRVSIARALVNDPVILLADEPTGNLDPETSWEIIQLLETINQKGTTVVLATHDKLIVDRLQRRVIELVEGRLVRDEPVGQYGSGGCWFEAPPSLETATVR